jgi:protein import protein ZIM17
MAFTCNICKNKQARTFSKYAYTKGVVLIRCEGCDSLHLIADNLGWFRDQRVNIEQIMKEKGEQI